MQMNILLYTNNLLTATARNKGSVENYCITLINLLNGSEFHFFNAFNRLDYVSKNEANNNLFFIPNDRFHIQEDTTLEELSLFLTKNRIKIIHIHQCGYHSINLFRKAANLSNCILITTCHSKPYALLLNYTYEYCIKKLKQVSLNGKLKILKRMLFLKANRNEATTEIRKMYHALFSFSDRVVLGSDYYVPELERILQREVSNNEYQIINYCVPFKKYFPEQFLKRMKLSEIAVVGVFDETRFNLNRIIDVWNKIQVGPKYIGWVLRIVGCGVSYAEYKNKVLTSKNIIFEDFSQLESCFSTSSIYLSLADLVEIIDPFLLGAMQNGLVPIVSGTSEIYYEIIDNENEGFILPANSDKNVLEEKLRALMDDEELRNKLGKHAVEKSKKYNQQKFKDAYTRLYS